MVDVDGAYLYRKQQSLIKACVKVSSLNIPAPSLSSWEVINESNVKATSPRFPVLTSGRNLFIVVWVNGINVTGVTVYVRIALCVSGVWSRSCYSTGCLQGTDERLQPLSTWRACSALG